MKLNSINGNQPSFGMRFIVNQKSIKALEKRETGSNVAKNLKAAITDVTAKLEKLYPEYGDRLTLKGKSVNKNNCEFFDLTASLKLTPDELAERKNLVNAKNRQEKNGTFYKTLPHVWLKYDKNISSPEQIGEKMIKRAEHIEIDPKSDKCIDFYY